MDPRRSAIPLAAVAVVFIGIGLVVGLSPHRASYAACGSVLKPDTSPARMTDSFGGMGGYEAACDKGLSDDKPVTYGALGLGAVAGLLAMVMAGQVTRTKDEEPDKLPT